MRPTLVFLKTESKTEHIKSIKANSSKTSSKISINTEFLKDEIIHFAGYR